MTASRSRPLPAPVSAYVHTGFETLMAQPLPLLLMGGLLALLEAASGAFRHGALSGLWLAFLVLLVQPARFAFAVACLDAVRGARLDEGSFDGMRRHYWTLVWAGLLTALLVIAGTLLLLVPGAIAYLRTRFVPYLIVEEGYGAADAVRESFARTRGLEWPLLWISVFGALASVIGFALCFVGAAPALALWDLTRAALYADAVVERGAVPQYS